MQLIDDHEVDNNDLQNFDRFKIENLWIQLGLSSLHQPEYQMNSFKDGPFPTWFVRKSLEKSKSKGMPTLRLESFPPTKETLRKLV